MVRKPTIGITCNYDYRDTVGIVSHMGMAGQTWNFLAGHYAEAVEWAGGIPVLIPQCRDFETVKGILSHVDGVLITGGHDIDPQCYGEQAKPYCGVIIPERDRQDIEIARYVMENEKKPLLGICRGMQVMNVAAGGTLYQDVEKEGGFDHHFMDMYPMNRPVHKVRLKSGSKVCKIFEKEILEVNSFHHQAVKDVAEGFGITAYSRDGVGEAIEKRDGSFVMGIQWHPEMMFDSPEQQKIFKALIKAGQRWHGENM